MSHLSRFGSPGRVPGRLQYLLKSSHVSRSGSPDPLSRFTNSRANLSRPTSPSLRPVSPLVERTHGASSRPDNRERNLSGLPETGHNTLVEVSGRFGSPDLGRPAMHEKVLRVPRLDLSAAIAYQEGGESDEKASNSSPAARITLARKDPPERALERPKSEARLLVTSKALRLGESCSFVP
jgi:hypothetical protein